jgi:hypothetical protein
MPGLLSIEVPLPCRFLIVGVLYNHRTYSFMTETAKMWAWKWIIAVVVISILLAAWYTWSSTSAPQSMMTLTATSTGPNVPGSIGVLTPFYRTEQIQGTYLETDIGSIVQKIPSYLIDSSLNYPYRFGVSNSGGTEVPYVTYPSVVRALGGWTSQFGAGSGDPDSTDPIRYNSSTGQWIINYSQITDGIQVLLSAGYTPSDITITLDNIPWDLSTQKCDDGDASPVEGVYGNRAPIANYPEWQTFIIGLAQSLNTLTKGQAADFNFKLGTESNSTGSYCGTITDYENYYASTVAALEKVIPNPKVSPFETDQTAVGGQNAFSALSVYEWLAGKGLPMNAVSDQDLYIESKGSATSPAKKIGAVISFLQAIHTDVPSTADLPTHLWQFGPVANTKVGDLNNDQLDEGPRVAGWSFQEMFELVSQEPFALLAHWDVFDQIPTGRSGKYLLPTPLAWLYQILDNLQGTEMYPLASAVTPTQSVMVPYTMGFASASRLTILASDYNTDVDNGASQTMTISIPGDILPPPGNGYTLYFIPMAVENTPSYLIKQALASGSIPGVTLAAPFTIDGNLVGTVATMAMSTSGASQSAANQAVGAALVGNDALATGVAASIKAMFTLQSYTGTLTKNADGSYTLNAGTFEPGEMKLFTID